MAETTLETVQTAFAELRSEVKAGTLTAEKQAQIEAVIDGYEDQNKKLALSEQEAVGQKAELKEMKEAIEASSKTQTEASARFDQLEVALARAEEAKTASADYREATAYKGLQEWAITGAHNETLRTDVNVGAGFLVPSELDNEIVKKIVELDDMRSIARVRTLSGKTLDIPKRTTIPTATFEGEAESGSNSESTYELQSLTPFRQTFSTQVTQDQLMNAAFDMQAEMGSDAALAFADGASNAYVQGTGVKQPYGFMQNATVQANVRNSLDADEITFASVIRLSGDLETGYNPIYVLNRKTLASLRALTQTAASPLWMPGVTTETPNTINGFPYVILPSMADEAADAFPMAFGDFRRGYTIADRTGMSVIRDEVTLKKQAIVEFTWSRWTTGDVVLPQAIRVLKCST